MKPYERDVTEALFLESHSKAEIVDMLRKHSYANELEIYKYKLYSGGAVGLDDGGKLVGASYVLSKGWIRFVKEKKLKVGDVVRFERSGRIRRCSFIVDLETSTFRGSERCMVGSVTL
ncbi:unnamed protein product [Malus baccata var. baccata]